MRKEGIGSYMGRRGSGGGVGWYWRGRDREFGRDCGVMCFFVFSICLCKSRKPPFEQVAGWGWLLFYKGDAAADPFAIFIEVDTDHFSLTKSGEIYCEGWSRGIVWPEIHHTNFRFGGDIRGRDKVGIFDFPLEDPILRVIYVEVG